MRGIVQYEVYVLDEGRWTLCGRYPGAQREDAVKEASATEGLTGRATKVVRDTYFPETNHNEEITTYISPKGRAMQAMLSRRKAMTAATRRDRDKDVYTTYSKRKQAASRPGKKLARISRAERTVRIVVALGASVLFATLVTALVSSILSQLASMVSAMPAGTTTTILTATYLIIFLFTFPRTYRARLWIHRLLLEMWENTNSVKAPVPVREKPRRQRAVDGFRPWDVMRFDKPPAPPVLEPVPLPPTVEPVHVQTVTIPLPEPPPPPKPPELNTKPQEPEKPATQQPPKEDAPAPAKDKAKDLTLERIVLRRFALDVVAPVITKSHRDDPVTRRGVAIILAGAAQGLAETSKVDAEVTLPLLRDALGQVG